MKIDVSKISDWWEYQTRDWAEGDKVVRKKFLLFPKTINKQMRWFEQATWEEEYTIDYFRGSDGLRYIRHYWRKNKWL